MSSLLVQVIIMLIVVIMIDIDEKKHTQKVTSEHFNSMC